MSDYKNFGTGAVRSSDREAVRYDLISPIGLRALAETYAEGAEKFGAHNWENGMPVTDILNHALAHIYDFLSGCRKEPHLAHAAWGLLAAIHSLEKWPELNAGTLRGPDCACPPNSVKPATAKKPQKESDILRQKYTFVGDTTDDRT